MINIESIRFSNRTKADKLDLNRTHTLAGNCRASRTLKACFNLVNLYFFVNHSYPRLTTLGVPLTFSAVILCFVVARFRASPSVCVQGRGATLGGGVKDAVYGLLLCCCSCCICCFLVWWWCSSSSYLPPHLFHYPLSSPLLFFLPQFPIPSLVLPLLLLFPTTLLPPPLPSFLLTFFLLIFLLFL